VVKDNFKDQYMAARRKPGDRLVLIDLLVKNAQETRDDMAARYVLLREARDQAVQAGDAGKALLAVEEMVQGFLLDGIELKLAALTEVAKTAATPPAFKDLADNARPVLEEAIAADRFDLASRIHTLAESAALKSQTPPLLALVQARGKELPDLQKEWEAYQAARALLEKTPEDPEANRTAGVYLCLRKGAWDAGLPYLHRGNDKSLQEAARLDLDRPVLPMARLDLADQWWKLAEARAGAADTPLKARAEYWYRKALPGLTGLHQKRVEKRIKDIGDLISASMATPAGEVRRFLGHTDKVLCVALSRDGRRALSGGVEGVVRLWDAETGQELKRYDNNGVEIRCLAFAPDGASFLQGGTDANVIERNLQTGAQISIQSPRNVRSIECVAYLPDGAQALFAANNRNVYLWSLKEGGNSRGTPVGIGPIHGMALSREGRVVALAGADGIVSLRQTDNLKEVGRIVSRTGEIRSVALSPDGRSILTGGADRTVRLWNVKNGQQSASFKGHSQRITSVAFSPDGSRILSASEDHTVRLWDIKGNRELNRFAWHTDKVWSAVYSGDGRKALTGGDDKTVRLWSMPR
jgi:hypothetical protein